MRTTLRRAVRRLVGPTLFTLLRGLYWSAKLRVTDYEPETQALRLFVSPGSVCLDVGGNFGQFACFLARAAGSEGRIYSFEPLPSNRRVFAWVMRLLGIHNVELVPCAVGLRTGQVNIMVPDVDTAEAYIAPSGQGLPVEVVTLDGWARSRNLTRVDFVKVDVEGFELFVLQGARTLLERSRPAVLCEVTGVSQERYGCSPLEVFEFMRGLGYRSFVWRNPRLVPCSKPSEPYYNYFFIHTSRSRPGDLPANSSGKEVHNIH